MSNKIYNCQLTISIQSLDSRHARASLFHNLPQAPPSHPKKGEKQSIKTKPTPTNQSTTNNPNKQNHTFTTPHVSKKKQPNQPNGAFLGPPNVDSFSSFRASLGSASVSGCSAGLGSDERPPGGRMARCFWFFRKMFPENGGAFFFFSIAYSVIWKNMSCELCVSLYSINLFKAILMIVVKCCE